MTQADSVHSTPPTNTSARHSRRSILGAIAAGGAAAAIAARPVPAIAASPADPIYAAIERHGRAVAAHDNATEVRAHFEDINMNDEQRKQLAVLQDAVDEAWDPREEAAIDLLNTEPTTLAGIVALCRYVEPLLDDDGELPEAIYWDDETTSSAGGAFANVIAAAVEALIKAHGGKVAQS